MKFSCRWLDDYVDLDLPGPSAGDAREAFATEISRRLTGMGHAVEDHALDPGADWKGRRQPADPAWVAEDDVVLDIEVTTNRVDAMCHLGMARELSALLDRPLSPPAGSPPEAAEPASGAIRVAIEDGRCARFAARVVRGVAVGESPAWLKRRLAAVGARSINNVVDVTNYVLWELGKPIHAYDLATIEGREIRVRAARAGEELTTLDGERRKLGAEDLVIADARRPVGLGGIIGGLETEVTGRTVDVLIESAHFDPRAVRRGARRFGIKTDASHRFERGVDPEVAAFAASRAAELVARVAGGTVLAGVVDVRFEPRASYRLEGRLEPARLARFVGLPVPPEDVERWLARLGFSLERDGGGAWRVGVPTWRYYDFQPVSPSGLCYESDLFEEVARLHGLDAIPATFPAHRAMEPPPSPARVRRRRVQDLLAAAGFAEAIHYAFIDPAASAALPSIGREAPPLALANPISSETAALRRSLLPGLVASARFNQRRGAEAVRLFEVGNAFFGRPEAGRPEEVELLGLAAGGVLGTPWEGRDEIDFFDLKGVLESLAEAFGVRLSARPAALPGLLEGASAELLVGGRAAGYLGRLGEEETYPLYVAELVLGALGEGGGSPTVELPSRLPGVAVDSTLTHAVEVPWSAIEAAISELEPEVLVSFALKDRYRGEGVPPGAVNTTIAFLYNAGDRSLTQEEVNEQHRALSQELARRFGWREPEGGTG